MRSSVWLLLAMVGLAGCAGQAEQESVAVAASEAREVAFGCDNGESVSVRFFPEQGVAVLQRHGTNIELNQQPAASGFWYSNGPNSIRGQGDRLTLEIGRMMPIQCQAQ